MTIDPQFMQSLTAYEAPVAFVGSFFFGETVILSAAYLAGQGIWSVVGVFFFALLGTLLADTVWFFFGMHALRWSRRWEKIKRKHDAIVIVLNRYADQRPFLVMLFIKFLYGTRILTILYLTSRRISFWLFLLFDAIGTAIWLVVMVGIGWLTGRGVVNLLPAVHSVQYFLTGLVVLLLVFKIVTTWLEKRIAKKL